MKIPVFVLIVLSAANLQARDKAWWPPFSWDTVPVYIHVGKSSGPLSDQEVKFVAKISDFVCLEKGHAKARFGSTEKGIAHDAKRLKKINPKMKVLFYWNTFLNYNLYDACHEIAKHPKWIFRDKAGQSIYKTGKLEQYNLLDPDFRKWWASVAGKGVSQYGCDGIFMDAANQAKRPLWMKKGWGVGNEYLLTEAVSEMMDLAKKAMGEQSILLYNGIRSSDSSCRTTGQEYLPHADGVNVEHFTSFHSRKKETITLDIEQIIKEGKEGKIVVVKGWPDPKFNWTNREKMKRPAAELAAEARKKITFSLACFLVAAQQYSYFCYSWGYRENHGNLIDYEEFHKPLGKPSGDAKKDGWTYTRSFKHASVKVDLEQRKAEIQFEDIK